MRRSTKTLHTHITIPACNGRPAQEATVYAVAILFNQFEPMQATPAADGTVTLVEQKRSGFPAGRRQHLFAVFRRATKPGDSLLDGVSSRRVVAFRFAHH